MHYNKNMTKWTLEPGHTAAEFKVRHMMVTWVRGSIKDVHGTLNFDHENPTEASVEIEMDARKIWSGEEDRDTHLKGEEFLDVENHPTITFKSTSVEQSGCNTYKVKGDLTIRGITKEVILETEHVGQWDTPFREDGEDKGPKVRAGFHATTKINRQDFGVNWQSKLDKGGVVAGDEVYITIDAEAIRD